MLDIHTLPVSEFGQNCRILVRQEDQTAVVVDPGGRNSSMIQDFLQQLGAKVTAILLTHGHVDHVGATYSLYEYCNEQAMSEGRERVKIYGPHKAEQSLLASLEGQVWSFGLTPSSDYSNFQKLELNFVEDNQVLQLFEDASFKVLTTPGHTPGGVSFYCKEENFVLTGDSLFCGSIGRTDFPGGDLANLLDSIKTKLLVLPEETEVLSGHGEDSTIGEEKHNNPFLG